MNNQADVSVIIPMHNAATYIGRTIASILEQVQHNLNLEIIVVDDASTDRSRELIRNLQIDTPIIKLIELQKNGGTAHARNTGLQHARGAWVQFVDSDDRICPDLYQKFERAQKPGFNCYVFSLIIEHHDRTVKRTITTVKDKRALGYFYAVWNFFIQKDLCLPFKEFVLEDVAFVFDVMAEKKPRIALIPDAWYILNRKNDDSKTVRFNAPGYRKLYGYLYSRLDRYDNLTRMFFLETFVGILFAPTVPLRLSAEIAARTLFKLFRHLPAVVTNGIRNCVVNTTDVASR